MKGNIMRLILTLILLFLVACNPNQYSNRENTRYIALFYLQNRVSSNWVSSPCFEDGLSYLTVIESISTNLVSLSIYQNNQFLFNSGVDVGSIYYPSSSRNTYIILFQNNNYFSHIQVYSYNGKNCGVDFYKNGIRINRVSQEFNLNLNQFTEIVLGEYKFIPER